LPDLGAWARPVKETISVFFTGKNRVVKIMYFSSKLVLQTTKHTMIYPSAGLFLYVIAICLAV
jgi:hypothetical protein